MPASGNLVDQCTYDYLGNPSCSGSVSSPFGFGGGLDLPGGLVDIGGSVYDPQSGTIIFDAKRKKTHNGIPNEAVWSWKHGSTVAYMRPLEGDHFNLIVRGIAQTEAQGWNFHIRVTEPGFGGSAPVTVLPVAVRAGEEVQGQPYSFDPTDWDNIDIEAGDMLAWISGTAGLNGTNFWSAAEFSGENFRYMVCSLVVSHTPGPLPLLPSPVNCDSFLS